VHKSHFGLCTISRVRGNVPTRDTFLGLVTSKFDVSKNMYGQGLSRNTTPAEVGNSGYIPSVRVPGTSSIHLAYPTGDI
jgi:hypothetical protein